MSVIKCSECGQEFESSLPQCPNCGCPRNLAETKVAETKVAETKAAKSPGDIFSVLRGTLLLLAAICTIVSGVFFYKAMDVKNHYYNSNYSSLNKNVYVGGDAYNYIINGTYFAGYSSIAGASMVCAAIFISGSVLVTVKMKERA